MRRSSGIGSVLVTTTFSMTEFFNRSAAGSEKTGWVAQAMTRVAPRSMVIPGTVEEWREWTGLPFDTTGPVVVPGALAPVMCDAEHGTATYVEPNVWVRHPAGR